jgi:hypothetical protein
MEATSAVCGRLLRLLVDVRLMTTQACSVGFRLAAALFPDTCPSPGPVLQLAKQFATGIPMEHLLPKLRELLITEFGATPRQVPATTAAESRAAAEPAGAAV